MLNVTDQAKDVLQEMREGAMLQAGVKDEQTAVRLLEKSASDGQAQLALQLDQPQEGDQIVEHNGANVLVLDPAISARLDGATLDTADTTQGRQLTIQPPGAPSP